MTAVLVAPPAVFNPDAAQAWLDTIHGHSAGHAWIGSTHDRFKGRAFAIRPGWTDQAVDHIARLDRAQAAGIYLRTTTLTHAPNEGRGSDTDSLCLPGLAADLDIAGPGHKNTACPGGPGCTHLTAAGRRKHTTPVLPLIPDTATARHLIDETGLLTPSLWVHSGGGLYPWWLLDQPHPITDHTAAAAFTERWQRVIGATAERLGYNYGHVGDLSRILRIPGTVNRKPAMPAPAPCRIVHDTDIRYTLANLRDNLRDAYAAIPQPAPVPLRPSRPTTRTGGTTPGDDFEARVDWADILTPHGWTFAYEHGGTRYWCRPGKTRRDGVSATTGRAADRDRLWVFTDATEFPQNTPMTKLGAYTLLNFGGTRTHHFAEANQELRRQGYGARQAAA